MEPVLKGLITLPVANSVSESLGMSHPMGSFTTSLIGVGLTGGQGSHLDG